MTDHENNDSAIFTQRRSKKPLALVARESLQELCVNQPEKRQISELEAAIEKVEPIGIETRLSIGGKRKKVEQKQLKIVDDGEISGASSGSVITSNNQKTMIQTTDAERDENDDSRHEFVPKQKGEIAIKRTSKALTRAQKQSKTPADTVGVKKQATRA